MVYDYPYCTRRGWWSRARIIYPTPLSLRPFLRMAWRRISWTGHSPNIRIYKHRVLLFTAALYYNIYAYTQNDKTNDQVEKYVYIPNTHTHTLRSKKKKLCGAFARRMCWVYVYIRSRRRRKSKPNLLNGWEMREWAALDNIWCSTPTTANTIRSTLLYAMVDSNKTAHSLCHMFKTAALFGTARPSVVSRICWLSSNHAVCVSLDLCFEHVVRPCWTLKSMAQQNVFMFLAKQCFWRCAHTFMRRGYQLRRRL